MKFLFLLPLFLNKFCEIFIINDIYRSSHPEVFLEKVVLKICSKFTGEHPCRSVISIKLKCIFCCIFSEHLFSRTPLGGCFCIYFHFHFIKNFKYSSKKNHRCLKEVIAQLLYIMIFIMKNL